MSGPLGLLAKANATTAARRPPAALAEPGELAETDSPANSFVAIPAPY